jgi:Flp pilus assembly pilin Flp
MSAPAKQRIRHLTRHQTQCGQGMTEYIIIVAMIAVAAIAVYQYFGQTVRNQTAAIAQELAGKDGTAAKNAAQTASDQAKTVGNQKHTLDTYVNQVGK